MKIHIHTKMGAQIFIAVFFLVATSNCQQFKYLSTDEQTPISTNNRTLFSNLKKNEELLKINSLSYLFPYLVQCQPVFLLPLFILSSFVAEFIQGPI